MLSAILLVHVVAAVCAPALVARLGRAAFLPLAAVPAVSLAIIAVAATTDANAGGAYAESLSWIGAYDVELAMRVDMLALLMVGVVSGIGSLIFVYCARYFSSGEPGLGRFAAVLMAFAGSMLGLVVADDLIMIYVFWELTTVFSYLLVGHDPTKFFSRQAALRALIITTLGGLALLLGFVMLQHMAGTSLLSEIIAEPPTDSPQLSIALVLILVGALSKSALFPFSFWLPGAMAAPTPVSAYLHAAAMVKAGVYLVARMGPAFHDVQPWREILVIGGLLTMFLGARRALQQYDLKLLLAHGTVSQLGYITVLVGAGTRNAALAGVAALLAHALFKATLFMVVGIIDHKTGTRDLRKLAGLPRDMPALAGITVLALASMAGLPPMLGFVAKEASLDAFLAAGSWTDLLVVAGLVISSALTFSYSARFLWGAFLSQAAGADTRAKPAKPSVAFLVAPTTLAALGLACGIGVTALDAPLARYADAYPHGEETYHLALWHGVTPALGLTVLVIALGLALSRFQHRAYTASDSRTLFGESEHTYRQTTRLVDRFALVITGLTQRGSLPVYLGTILVAMIAGPGIALVVVTSWPDEITLAENPVQALVVAVIVLVIALIVRSQHRLHSAILAGVAAYGVAVLFVLHGAPDLVLTQFLIETVSLILFVLVLRRLPARFSGQAGALRKTIRVTIAVSVGALVAGLSAVAIGARDTDPVSQEMPAAAEEAGGDNIVNVTLVDIRAWDTMGELFVLAAATVGVASLIFLRRRTNPLSTDGDTAGKGSVWATPTPATPPSRSQRGRRATVQTWLAGGETLAPERRSLVLEVVTRIAFHVMVVLSVFVLFAGHNDPGGGFAGGLVVGLALVLRYLAGGRYELAEAVKLDPRVPIGIGLALAVGTGVGAMFLGGEVLQSAYVDVGVPLVGDVHLSSSALFDVGVYLVVIGLVLEILTSLGVQLDRHAEREREGANR